MSVLKKVVAIAIVIAITVVTAVITNSVNVKNFSAEKAELQEKIHMLSLEIQTAEEAELVKSEFEKAETEKANDEKAFIDLIPLDKQKKNEVEDFSNFKISRISSNLPGVSVNSKINRVELLEGKFNNEEADPTILKIYMDENPEDFRVTFFDGDNSHIGNLKESALFADGFDISFRGYFSDTNRSLTINGLPQNISYFKIKTREATPGYVLKLEGQIHTIETIMFIFPVA